MFGFQRLDVWKKAIDWADGVYEITEQFPKEELFGLRSQIRRAAASVSTTLAEGSGRSSKKEFIRFIQIAYGSLMEIISLFCLAKRRNFVIEEQFQTINSGAEELAKMLSGLRSSLQRDHSPEV